MTDYSVLKQAVSSIQSYRGSSLYSTVLLRCQRKGQVTGPAQPFAPEDNHAQAVSSVATASAALRADRSGTTVCAYPRCENLRR
jgi:hypothetical protein